MDFRGQYLTYDEYQALGGTLDMTPFNLLEFEARRKIDILTSDRLRNLDEVPEEVKLCVNALVNSIDGYNKTSYSIADKGNVASENIDGYSLHYNHRYFR